MYRKTLAGLLFGITLLIGCLWATHHQALAWDRQGIELLIFVVATLALYIAIAVLIPESASYSRLATFFGMAMGGCWVMEVVAGNCGVGLGLVGATLFYRTPIAAVVILNLVVAVAAAAKTCRLLAGIGAGVESGMVSGLIAMLALTCLIVFGMKILIADPANVREFVRSNRQDLTLFITREYLFAGVNHLWIGLLGGLILGGAGGAIGRWRSANVTARK
jgi:hypothetical protein